MDPVQNREGYTGRKHYSDDQAPSAETRRAGVMVQ